MTPTATPEQTKDGTMKRRTRQDAGRIGGLRTAKKHGSEFFRTIGRAGGKARGDTKEVKKDESETEEGDHK